MSLIRKLFLSTALAQLLLMISYPNKVCAQNFDAEMTQFYKDVENKRLVLLGEQTHGDGATFEKKLEIIKRLHEDLGFNIIAFESGLFDNYKAHELYKNKGQKVTVYFDAVGEIWSDTETFKKLLDYIEERRKKGFDIKLLGFDSQEGSLFEEYFIKELNNLLNKNGIAVEKSLIEDIKRTLVSKDLIKESRQQVKVTLFDELNLLVSKIENISKLNAGERIVLQTLKSQISDSNFELEQLQGKQIEVQNPRDNQMAKNLIFLSEFYPQEKIIGWGASYHFSRSLESIDFDEITQSYLVRQDSLYKIGSKESIYYTSDDYDWENPLKGGIPMGDILKEHFKDGMYSLGFTSYEGNWGIVGETSIPILKPPPESIESVLIDEKKEEFFVDLKKNFSDFYYSSIFGNVPFKAKWGEIFDGLLFIRNSYQPLERNFQKDMDLSKTSPKLIRGRVIDFYNDKTLPNAEIRLIKYGKTIVSNSEGYFQIDASKISFDDKIIVSTMGYRDDSVSVRKIIKQSPKIYEFKLEPQLYGTVSLDEVTVISEKKELSADEILQKVRENLKINYVFAPYNQKFYYRHTRGNDSIISSGEEVILNTYNKNGMKAIAYPDQKIYGEIEKIRNIGSKKLTNSVWERFGNVSIVFNRGVILSKANVLHRTSSYELKKEGVVGYQNRKVYKISFTNETPGSHSTGFGYPAPIFSSGYLYVDMDNYAVLQYEHCIIREPYKSKENQSNSIHQSHRLFFSYRKDNGFYIVDHAQVNDKVEVFSDEKAEYPIKTQIVSRDLINLFFNPRRISPIAKPLWKVSRPKKLVDKQTNWDEVKYIFLENKLTFDSCN